MKRPWFVVVLGAVLSVCVLIFAEMYGCSGGGGGGGATTGTLQTAITDARPSAGSFTAVHVTVDRVVAVPAGKEGSPDNDPSLPVLATFPGGSGIDILNLHFVPQILGTVSIPAGNYTQLRLILAPNQPPLKNYVTVTGSATQSPLTTPSAQETGLKINGNFTVRAGTVNTILIDFNPSAAIVFAGNSGQVLLKPTGIKILQVFSSLTNAGAVSGEIRSAPFTPWSSATLTVVPRNPAGDAVTNGSVFSNFSTPGVWKAPFTVFLPPNGSAAVASSNYKLLVQASNRASGQAAGFSLYSSPLFSVSAGVDTVVPPGGTVPLSSAP